MKGERLQRARNKLSDEQKAKVEARSKELHEEYLTLQDLRKANLYTQERMAALLDINQENVSRLEKRSDLLISTLQSYVEAMGGSLKLVAEFPNRGPVVLEGLGTLQNGDEPVSEEKPRGRLIARNAKTGRIKAAKPRQKAAQLSA